MDYCPKQGSIYTKFLPVMQCKVTHHLWYSFYSSLKNSQKLIKRTDFLAHSKVFFIYTLLHPMGYSPISCKIKGLMIIHNFGNFHQYSIFGCQVKNFQKFLIPIQHPWNGPCFFFGSYSTWYGSILMKISCRNWIQPNMLKKKVGSPLPFPGKICEYILPYLGYFWQETGPVHKSEGQKQNLIYSILPTWFLKSYLTVTKVWFQHFPILQL